MRADIYNVPQSRREEKDRRGAVADRVTRETREPGGTGQLAARASAVAAAAAVTAYANQNHSVGRCASRKMRSRGKASHSELMRWPRCFFERRMLWAISDDRGHRSGRRPSRHPWLALQLVAPPRARPFASLLSDSRSSCLILPSRPSRGCCVPAARDAAST